MAAAVLFSKFIASAVTEKNTVDDQLTKFITSVNQVLTRRNTHYTDDLDHVLAADGVTKEFDRDVWMIDVNSQVKQRVADVAGLSTGVSSVADPNVGAGVGLGTSAPGQASTSSDVIGDSLLATIFPTDAYGDNVTVVDYVDPDPEKDRINSRQPNDCPVTLKDDARIEQYKTYRIQLLSWIRVQSELKYLQTAVRSVMMKSIGATTRNDLVTFLGKDFEKTSLDMIVKWLDRRFKLLAPMESKVAIKEFQEFKQFQEFKAFLYGKALNAGSDKKVVSKLKGGQTAKR